MKTGAVHDMTAARHTSREFITFLTGLVDRAERAQEIHVVLDNLSAHKSRDVEQFLAEHPKVRFHFTPTYSSWLNQVELWFAKIQRDVIARGVFTSVADLGNKLRKYIRAYFEIPASRTDSERRPGMSRIDQAANAVKFLEDKTHEHHFDRLMWSIREARDRAASQVPEWEQLRDLGSAIKEHTLSNLAKYLEEFEANAKRNGVLVHWAQDAHEHNQILSEILSR
ncbi:MAG TPA: IS630 family transposase, partial [Bryobacteraceae bacterium]|nr:IS630 family transposase [Bryobacteraceae bacterium]